MMATTVKQRRDDGGSGDAEAEDVNNTTPVPAPALLTTNGKSHR